MNKKIKNDTTIYKRKDGRWCGSYYDGGKRRYVYGKTKREVREKIWGFENRKNLNVEKNTSVYQRKDGRWTGYYYNESEKRCYVYGKTAKDVQDKLDERFKSVEKLNEEVLYNTDIVNEAEKQKRYSLQDWTYEYLISFKKNDLKRTTFRTYMALFRKHIMDSSIGKLLIDEITVLDLQNYYNGKSKDGYNSKTIRHMAVIINEALNYAVKSQLLKYNPNVHTILPKKQKYEAEVLSKDEVITIVTQAKHEEIYPIVVTDLFTGMRKGEIMGLKWENVDFDNHMIYIKGSLCRVEMEPDEKGIRRSRYEILEPKTKKSSRSIPMLEQTREALLIQKQRQEQMKEAYKDIYVDRGFVFARYDGLYLNQRKFMEQYHEFLKKYGIKDIRFHDLRHTFASLLIESGISAKVVQELLGHTTITTTMDIYTHISENTKIDALERMSVELKGNNGKNKLNSQK